MVQNAPAEDPAAPGSSAPNIVDVPCSCPGSPHSGDTVTLFPKATVQIVGAATAVMVQGARMNSDQAALAVVKGRLADVYLHTAIASWSFVTADRMPARVTDDLIEVYLSAASAYKVADAADDLYGKEVGEVFLPLALRYQKSSQASLTATSTSATPESGAEPPKPPKRSSPTATAGKL